MKLYLAGPMRGYPEFNFPVFHAAAKWLRGQGHEVFNPAEEDRGGENLREIFARDTSWICGYADGLALLQGWHNSKGAKAELALAQALGLRAYYLYLMPSQEWYLLEAEDLG